LKAIPAEPVTAIFTTSTKCTMGDIGITLNGVSIYSGAVDRQCAQVNTDDDESEWTSFDMCDGHAQMTGDYHYHFAPSCLNAQAEVANPSTGTAEGHSPQLGWAYDGFPVYGPLYTAGAKVAGLDACGGKAEEIADLDGFKYRYYFTGDTSNLYSLPAHPKPDQATASPFTFDCYVGCT
jgi:hypothetical protein